MSISASSRSPTSCGTPTRCSARPRRPAPPATLARAVGGDRQEDQLFANDRLLFGATFKEWKPAKHPLYGDIEIGGFVKESQRVPPTFMIEELCHRNAAFVIYHADQMPRLEFGDVEVKPLGAETSRRHGDGQEHPGDPQRRPAGRRATTSACPTS